MACDEMNEITEDRWEDDIWGSLETPTSSCSTAGEAADTKPHPPKLFFLFGRADHWVADHTRDELMAARGSVNARRNAPIGEVQEGEREALLDGREFDREVAKWSPLMEIDESGIPHGFCIREFTSLSSLYIRLLLMQEYGVLHDGFADTNDRS